MATNCTTTININTSDDLSAESIELRFKKSSENNWQSVSYPFSNTITSPTLELDQYDFQFRIFDNNGNTSNWSNTYEYTINQCYNVGSIHVTDGGFLTSTCNMSNNEYNEEFYTELPLMIGDSVYDDETMTTVKQVSGTYRLSLNAPPNQYSDPNGFILSNYLVTINLGEITNVTPC